MNGFIWFQADGMTYNFVANNLSTIVSICLLFAKILMIKVIRNIIKLCYKNFEFKLKRIMSILIMESFCSTTVLIIAAESCILNFGNHKFTEKLNQVFHNIFFFFVPLLPFAFLLNAMWPKNINKNDNKEKE